MAKSSDNKRIKNILVGVIIGVFCLGVAFFEWFPVSFSADALRNAYINGICGRLCGIAALVLLLGLLRVKLFAKPLHLFYLLPCALIVLNNFQWWSYFSGLQSLERTSAWDILLFIGYCLSVGVFEELIFRGLLFTLIASYLPKNKKGLLWTVVISSVLFGAAHLLNGNVFQALYSVLTGGLFAFVLIKTQNLLCCGITHGAFNACGLLMDSSQKLGLGTGVKLFNLGTLFTMGVGILLSVAFVAYSLLKTPETEQKSLYSRMGIEQE